MQLSSGVAPERDHANNQTIEQERDAIPATFVPRNVQVILQLYRPAIQGTGFDFRAQSGSKSAVVDDDIGFLIDEQTQSVVIAGSNCGPLIVDHRDLGVQLGLGVLNNLDTGFKQLGVERFGDGILHIKLPDSE